MAAVPVLDIELSSATLEDEIVGLFDLLREPLLRYMASLGLPVADGEEIVQEVFLALFQHLRRGGDRANLRGWVFRVAHNWGLKVRALHAAESPFDPDLEARLAAPAHDAEYDLLERERMVSFHHAVESLSDQQKRCLFLRLEGLRYPEIAAAMGISASAVCEFLRRAMARLKKVRDE